ncbi:MAG: hypothetical protein H6834_05380 [Planctomycetes bacterium]|nr:hypothetical protein [Planctomycetota bacterium]
MNPGPLTFLCATLFVASSIAQTPPVPGNRNGVRLHGSPPTTFLQSFPNYLGIGNQPGDAIHQIYPRRVLTSASGTLELTAVVLPIYVQNQTTGSTALPDVSFHETQPISGGPPQCLVPDMASNALGRIVTGPIALPMGASPAFLVEVAIGGTTAPGITLPNADIALVVEAPPGEGIGTPDSVRLFQSRAGSSPDLPGCGFGAAGSYDATTGHLDLYAPEVELFTELAFREPMVFPVISRDGGLSLDEGYGAFDPPLARGRTTLGWGLEASQSLGHFAVPFVSVTGANGLFTVGGRSVRLDVGPFLDLLIVMGQVRLITNNGSPPPSLDGVWRSFQFPLPLDPHLAGTELHVAVMTFGLAGSEITFLDASNTCSVTIRP